MSTKIGIIGSGVVAQALAAGCIKHGMAVTLGTRDRAKLAAFQAKHPAAQVASTEEAARIGDIVVLAVKGKVAEELVKTLAPQLAGKTVIDTTNPIADAPPQNGVLRFFTSLDKSLLEILQSAAPDAHFVKAFNCVGSAHMVDPAFAGGKPTMFIAGNHDGARKQVAGLLETFGWEVADMGKAEAARAIEPLCMLWCIPGFTQNQWSHAFKLVR
ncbi:MAG: NAD(P)-binding domain-containing protein [Cyclobacteriaceae bacterium]